MKSHFSFSENAKLFLLAVLICLFINPGFGQLIKPLKGGERICWVGNSFSGFFGPVTSAISAIYKVANPTLKPFYFATPGKGCGILKEYVVWGSVAGGTGSIDTIRHGNWDYCVFQTWEDAVGMYDVCPTFMGCGGPNAYPKNQDTLLKYLKILDAEAKKVGSRTMLYAPHVGTYNYLDQFQKSWECFNKVVPQVSNMFFAPVLTAWDSVKHDYPTTKYACKDATSDGFIKLLYSDCGHQNANGMALDAFTFYTIFSGGLSAVGLNPTFPIVMENPEMRDYFAGIGCKIGRKILLQNGFPNDFEAPTIPAGFAASNITESGFTLSWTASTDNVGVAGYEVTMNGLVYNTTATNSITIGGLGSGLSFNFIVRSYDAAGHYSIYSQVYTAATNGTPILTNGSFETPVVTGNKANPVGSSWAFTSAYNSNAGISATPPSLCEGNQAAYMFKIDATVPTMSQTTTLAAGNYKCTFYTTLPSWHSLNQPLKFAVGSTEYDIVMNTKTTWEKHDVLFTVAADGSYVIKFYIPNLSTAQTYAFVDNVTFTLLNDKQAPTVPAGLAPSNIGSTNFTLSWANSTDNVGVAGYEIFKDGVSAGTSGINSFSVTGLSASTSYSMTVSAKDAAGNVSAKSTALVVKTITPDTQAPAVPTGLSSSAVTDVSFVLSWVAATDNVGVTEYQVFRDGALYGTVIGTELSMPIPWCVASTTYSMTVKAKDAAGNLSAASTALKVTTNSAPDTQAPTVPAGLSSSNVTQTGFTLSWTASTDNKGVTGYEVFRGTTSFGTTASTSLSVTGLTANTTYSMTVKAKDAAGNVSAASNSLNLKTLAATDTQAPTAPSGLKSSGITTTEFTLSWTASTDNVGVTTYEVFKNGISSAITATTSFKLTSLSAATKYTMTVKAKDAAGNVSTSSAALVVNTKEILSVGAENSEISIFPNPASDYIIIQGMQNPLARIEIINLLGEKVYSGTASDNSSINVSLLPKGIFIVIVSDGEDDYNLRFVKE